MTSRVASAALWALALLGMSSACAAGDPFAHTAAVARAEAEKAIGSEGVFSITTAVIVDGRIVQSEAFGTIGSDRTMRPDARTQFNAGSISKVFTAVAILRLRDLGAVDLDRPVVQYLPQFRMADPRYRRITVRMLLDHSSGFPGTNYYDLFASTETASYVAQTLALLEGSTLKAYPGDTNVYCNDCFIVAQAIVEKLSGLSLREFVQREIFDKAGMSDSSYGFKPGNANVAATYAAGPQGAMMPSEQVNALGTGGLTTTAVDLCMFSRALMEGKLLSPRSMKDLKAAQPGRLGAGYSLARTGLGWDTVSEPTFAERGVTVLGKDGFTTVFRSQMFIAPKQNVAAVTILAGPASLSGDVVIGIGQRLMAAALQDSGRMPPHATRTPSPPSAVASIPGRLLPFEGIYGGMGHSIIRLSFDRSANTLKTARLVDGRFVEGAALQYRGDGRFYGAGNLGYSLAVGKDGRKLLRQHAALQGGVVTVAEGVSPEAGVDTSEFKGVTWVPLNMRASDFVTLMYGGLYRTGTIDGLPGVVYLHDGNPGSATPYRLVDKRKTKMILQYEADLLDLEIVQKYGRKVLKAGYFEFGDAATVAPLRQGERVVIESDGFNVARTVTTGGQFKSTVPAGARIVIYAPGGVIVFDSLFDRTPAVAIVPGSLVLFIGSAGTAFEASVS
jgi:CubicO group peptidase (beta-lactamase class C family)